MDKERDDTIYGHARLLSEGDAVPTWIQNDTQYEFEDRSNRNRTMPKRYKEASSSNESDFEYKRDQESSEEYDEGDKHVPYDDDEDFILEDDATMKVKISKHDLESA
jgi:hypothetical protein